MRLLRSSCPWMMRTILLLLPNCDIFAQLVIDMPGSFIVQVHMLITLVWILHFSTFIC